jgi:hypothetical protein
MSGAGRPVVHSGPIRDVLDAYLAGVDREAPGLVEGLYLVGSIALDDYRPGASDVDFVAVTRSSPTATDVDALRRAHERLARAHRRPFLDGAYVTWAELAADPASAAPGPGVHEGRLHPRGGRDPVAWHTLARHGVRVRGPSSADLTVWTDRAALTAWCRGNLDDYWRRWYESAARPLSRRSLACLGSWGPAWAVLGVSRLHYTVATGEITSKDGAGRYAREVFPARWHPIIDECLRLRRGEAGRSRRFVRRRDTLAFLEMALAAR